MTQARTAAGARTLEARYYTSAEIFAREMDRIFASSWVPAGRAQDLPECGSFLLFDLGRDSALVLRDEAGAVRAFHNVCRHRGTRICDEPSGRLGGTIRCPYHAWTYALDGRLVGAPNMKEVPGFDPAAYPLHTVTAGISGGEVFVHFAGDPAPLADAHAPIATRIHAWQIESLVPVHRITYDVRANWKLIFQNYSECYHCPSLHPALNRLTPFRDASNDLTEGPILGGPMRLSGGCESMTMTGRRCAPPLAGVPVEDLGLVYYYTIFPGMLLSLHPDYVLVHRIRPVAVDRTAIVCDWLFHPEAAAAGGFDPAPAIEFWNTTNGQDWWISERSQRGIASRAYVPGPYADLESMIAAWDRHYLAALGSIA